MHITHLTVQVASGAQLKLPQNRHSLFSGFIIKIGEVVVEIPSLFSGSLPQLFQRTGVASSERIAKASSQMAVGEAIVSRQPLFPQEHGLPPRVITGICPISAHCSVTPCQI